MDADAPVDSSGMETPMESIDVPLESPSGKSIATKVSTAIDNIEVPLGNLPGFVGNVLADIKRLTDEMKETKATDDEIQRNAKCLMMHLHKGCEVFVRVSKCQSAGQLSPEELKVLNPVREALVRYHPNLSRALGYLSFSVPIPSIPLFSGDTRQMMDQMFEACSNLLPKTSLALNYHPDPNRKAFCAADTVEPSLAAGQPYHPSSPTQNSSPIMINGGNPVASSTAYGGSSYQLPSYVANNNSNFNSNSNRNSNSNLPPYLARIANAWDNWFDGIRKNPENTQPSEIARNPSDGVNHQKAETPSTTPKGEVAAVGPKGPVGPPGERGPAGSNQSTPRGLTGDLSSVARGPVGSHKSGETGTVSQGGGNSTGSTAAIPRNPIAARTEVPSSALTEPTKVSKTTAEARAQDILEAPPYSPKEVGSSPVPVVAQAQASAVQKESPAKAEVSKENTKPIHPAGDTPRSDAQVVSLRNRPARDASGSYPQVASQGLSGPLYSPLAAGSFPSTEFSSGSSSNTEAPTQGLRKSKLENQYVYTPQYLNQSTMNSTPETAFGTETVFRARLKRELASDIDYLEDAPPLESLMGFAESLWKDGILAKVVTPMKNSLMGFFKEAKNKVEESEMAIEESPTRKLSSIQKIKTAGQTEIIQEDDSLLGKIKSFFQKLFS